MAESVNLTDAKILGLKPPAQGRVEISDAKVPGLRLRVSASGVMTFIVRKRTGGTVRNLTIGRYGPRLSLATARKRARDILNDIDAGKAVAPVRRGAMTIASLWPEYRAVKADKRSIGEIERIFTRYIIPQIGDRLADAVTRGDVTRFIDSIEAPVMARAVHAQLSSFYTWALPRLDDLPANPCTGAGRPAKPKARDRVLTDAELVALWHEAERQPSPWGPAIKLLILTGQRRSEVFEAERAEFDLGAALWTIPAERAKNGVTHLVPLSRPAVGLLRGIGAGEGTGLLFPAHGSPDNPPSGISKAQRRIEAAVAEALGRDVPHWTLHDIRRTVATGLQGLGIRFEVTEAIHNHISGSKGGIAGVYQRHDWAKEKRAALDRWAAHILRLASGKQAGKVVPIRGAG